MKSAIIHPDSARNLAPDESCPASILLADSPHFERTLETRRTHRTGAHQQAAKSAAGSPAATFRASCERQASGSCLTPRSPGFSELA
jgi:hypothetical protein